MEKKKMENEKDKNKEKNYLNNNQINLEFYKTLSSDIFRDNYYNNRACIFSFHEDNNIYIVYGIITLDLECYDLTKEEKFILIKNLHNKSFDSCRHYYDSINIRDFIITSSLDNHVKIINFKKKESELILDLNFESKKSIINTAYFVSGKIMVPFSNINSLGVEYPIFGNVELYDMNFTFIGKFEENAGFILGLSNYYCKKTKRTYILVSNTEGILSYIVEDLSLYKKFIPKIKDAINGYDESCIIEKNEILVLVCPCFYYEYIHFWDFKSGELISKMSFDTGISDICLWNNNYIFASFNDYNYSQMILINTTYNKIEKEYIENSKDSRICGIKILKHKSKGDFLISSDLTGNLNLYKINRNN